MVRVIQKTWWGYWDWTLDNPGKEAVLLMGWVGIALLKTYLLLTLLGVV